MESMTFQTTGSAKIRIATIGGRLQIRGWEATSVEVRGGMSPSASLPSTGLPSTALVLRGSTELAEV